MLFKKRAVFIITSILTVSVLLFWYSYASWPVFPDQQIKEAKKAISAARKAKAEVYSYELFKNATSIYDSAMNEYATQNGKWILSRNYATADSLFLVSAKLANQASQEAVINRKNFDKSTSKKIDELQLKYDHYDHFISWLPLPDDVNQRYFEGKLQLSTITSSKKNGNLASVNEKINTAGKKIKFVENEIKKLLKSYFEDYPKWKSMSEDAFLWTNQHKKALLLIDKFNRKCYVIENGKIEKSYHVELGNNWIGDKMQKGDKSTPEGKYKITKKKKNKETKYHKALLINYPNDDDKKHFQKLISTGQLPANSQIGGLIEIHGGGGRDNDWTDGCVALSNEDMDQLYGDVVEGTPVIIIGSLYPLNEVINYK